MKKSQHLPVVILALLVGGALGLSAKSISVNLTPTAGDSVDVNADESSVIGISGAETVSGSGWNNIRTRPAGSLGDPTVFRAATQGGNHLDMIDSTTADSGVDMTSDGTFYFNFGSVSNPSQISTGDAGLMHSYLLTNSSETISLSGLAAWAPNGYVVYAMFDIGAAGPRTYGIKVTDGTTTQSFWTADTDSDTGGFDSDTNNDGIIEWKQTTATTSGAAVSDANYAVFGTFTGDTMTISGADGTRAVLSGFQIVAIPQPGFPELTGPMVTNVTATGADASVTLGNSAATDVTLFWDTIDQGTGVWSNSIPLGAQAIGPVSGNITGLSPDTLYFYRFHATNTVPDLDLESWSSAATSFATVLTGKSVTDLSSSLFAQNEIDLQWTDNFETETAFSIRRSETPGGPYTEIATVTADTDFYTDNDPLLTQGVTYYYVVVAINATGDSGLSNETSKMNGPIPAPAPKTKVISIKHTLDKGNNGLNPTPLASSDIAGLVPATNWNNITLLNGFANPSPHVNNATIPAGSLRDSDGNVVAGASYSVTSTDSWGSTNLAFNNTFGTGDDKLFGDTPIFGETDNAALVIDGLSSTFTSGGYRVIIYTLSDGVNRTAQWSMTPKGQSEITYDSASESTQTSAFTTTGKFLLSSDFESPGNYIVFDVPAGIDGFTLTVNSTTNGRAPINGMQIVAKDNPILVDPVVSAITTTDAQVSATLQQAAADVTLFWDSVDPGVRGTWSNSSSLGAQAIGPVSASIPGLTSDMIVFYRFFAANTVPDPDLEAWSADGSFFATTLSGKAITDLSATLFAPGEVDLFWTDNFNSESGFRIRWSTTPGGPYIDIDTVPAGTQQYTDSFASPGANYYVVVAFNAGGDSDISNQVSVGDGATFASWISGFGLDLADQDALDDPDGDNLSNLVEGFFGSNPAVANGGLSSPSTNGTTTTFTHPQANPALSDVTGSYEWSLDLNTWYAGDGVDGPVGGATVNIPKVTPVGGTATVTATASEPLTELFIRVKVSN